MLTQIIVRRAPPNANERKLPSMIPEDCFVLFQNSFESEWKMKIIKYWSKHFKKLWEKFECFDLIWFLKSSNAFRLKIMSSSPGSSWLCFESLNIEWVLINKHLKHLEKKQNNKEIWWILAANEMIFLNFLELCFSESLKHRNYWMLNLNLPGVVFVCCCLSATSFFIAFNLSLKTSTGSFDKSSKISRFCF